MYTDACPLDPGKKELAQNIRASSIQCLIRVACYCTENAPGPPRGPGNQPFPSFRLKLSSAGLTSHHTAVVPVWLDAVEVVTTTQYLVPAVSGTESLARAVRQGAIGMVVVVVPKMLVVSGAPEQLSPMICTVIPCTEGTQILQSVIARITWRVLPVAFDMNG